MDIFRSVIVWILGICFLVFFFPLTFIIWLIVLPFDSDRNIIHWILSCQSMLLIKLFPIWKADIKGKEKIAAGTTYVIISNHQSMLDILFLNSLCYRFKWISKIENMKVPVLGWYLRLAGYITVDRGNEDSKAEMLEKSFSILKNGISIMIFPEGTRSANKEIGFFKRGAFQLAIQAEVPLLPVVIDGTGDVLPKHGLIFGSGHKITLRVLDPIFPDSFNHSSPEDLALQLSSAMTMKLNEIRRENALK